MLGKVRCPVSYFVTAPVGLAKEARVQEMEHVVFTIWVVFKGLSAVDILLRCINHFRYEDSSYACQ